MACSFLWISLAFGQADYINITNLKDTTDIIENLKKFEGFPEEQKLDSAAKALLNHTLEQSIKLGYDIGIRKATYWLMIICYNKLEFNHAIHYANALIPRCTTDKNQDLLQRAYVVKGVCYDALENFSESFDNYTMALRYANSLNRALIYNNMAVLMQNVKQYNKALYYLKKGQEEVNQQEGEENANQKIKRLLLVNKAVTYAALNENVKSIRFYDSALYYASTITDIVDIRSRKMSSFNKNKANSKALEEFAKILPFLNNDSVPPRIKANVYITVGGIYCDMGNYAKARKYLLQAQSLSQFLWNAEKQLLQHKFADLYYKTGDYKKAYDLHYLYHKIDDSIRSSEIQLQVSEQETRYRTAQKDKALAEQQIRLLEGNKLLYRNWAITIAIVTCLIILLLILWLRYSYQKRKNLELQSNQEINRLQLLMEGEERERTRLSQELHDGVNSSLAATSSYLGIVEQHHPEIAQSPSFKKVKELLQSTSSEVRMVAHNLAPHNLIRGGLKQALEDYCTNLFHLEVAFEIQVFGAENQLSDYLSLMLYRIAQELLHNIYKHARATEVIVMLGILENETRLTVEDNGRGMPSPDLRTGGIGMDNLKSRVARHKGSISIESGHNGTAVHISFPISPSEVRAMQLSDHLFT